MNTIRTLRIRYLEWLRTQLEARHEDMPSYRLKRRILRITVTIAALEMDRSLSRK